MTRAVAATQRTVNAIRKADKLPRDITVNKSNRLGISYTGRKGGGGTSIYWAKILTVVDSNNYTADVYYSRSSQVAGGGADDSNVKLRVWDIVDEVAVGDYIPVIPATASFSAWVASTAYSLNVTVKSTAGDVYKCTTAGTSGSSEPTWDTTVGNTTNDGTVVWTRIDDSEYDYECPQQLGAIG